MSELRFSDAGEGISGVVSRRCPSLECLELEHIDGMEALTLRSDSLLSLRLAYVPLRRLDVAAGNMRKMRVKYCLDETSRCPWTGGAAMRLAAPALEELGWEDAYPDKVELISLPSCLMEVAVVELPSHIIHEIGQSDFTKILKLFSSAHVLRLTSPMTATATLELGWEDAYPDKVELISLPSCLMEVAVVELPSHIIHEIGQSDFTKILKLFSSAHVLRLTSPMTATATLDSEEQESLIHSVQLPYYSELDLGVITNGHSSFGSTVVHFLRRNSSIRNLTLTLNPYHPKENKFAPCCMSNCTCHEPLKWWDQDIPLDSLEQLVIKHISGHREAKKLVYFIMRNSKVLKKITLVFSNAAHRPSSSATRGLPLSPAATPPTRAPTASAHSPTRCSTTSSSSSPWSRPSAPACSPAAGPASGRASRGLGNDDVVSLVGAAARLVTGRFRLDVSRGINISEDYDEEANLLALPCFERATEIAISIADMAVQLTPDNHRGRTFAHLTKLNLSDTFVADEGELLSEVVSHGCPCLKTLQLVDIHAGARELTIHTASLLTLCVVSINDLQLLEVDAANLRWMKVKDCFDIDAAETEGSAMSLSTPAMEEFYWEDCCPEEVKLVREPAGFLHKIACVDSASTYLSFISGSQSFYTRILQLFSSTCTEVLQIEFPIKPESEEQKKFLHTVDLPYCSELELIVEKKEHTLAPTIVHLLKKSRWIKRFSLKICPKKIHIQCEPNCTCRQPPNWRDQEISLGSLEELSIEGFGGTYDEKQLVLFIVENSKVLRKVSLVSSVNLHSYKSFLDNLRQLCTSDCTIELNNNNLV
uniref:FBD domain-containing protein n=1 Tax=Oryza barthii TaxID=65489 RepID=A0A0D3GS62_9ORYZ